MEIKATSIVMVPINKIIPNEKNNNIHTEEQKRYARKIFDYQGFRSPLLISNRTGKLVAGHLRLEIAKEKGVKELPCMFQDFDSEEQEYAHLTADNALAAHSSLNYGQINTDILELGPFDIDLLGIKDFVIEPIEKFEPQSDEDAVPDVVHPITRKGDIWLLGNHRLMCGDSTMIDDVDNLMNGEKADMVFTDPPYNQSKSGGGLGQRRPGWQAHKSDHLNNFDPECIYPMVEMVQAKSSYFFCNKALLPSYTKWAAERGGWDLLVMAKKNPIPLKGKKYLSDIEYLVFSRDHGAHFNDSLEYDYYRKVRQVSVRQAEYGHPTEKQISFIEPYVQISSPINGLVFEPFTGSGTTMIAAEKHQRKCYGMELDEKYCDVIIKRWEQYTGKKATLELTGQTYEELKLERDNQLIKS
jgi:DNA modification methylase